MDAARRDIVEAGGIRALVALVRSDAVGSQQQASKVLWSFSSNNAAAIATAGGVEALVKLVRNGAPGGQKYAPRRRCGTRLGRCQQCRRSSRPVASRRS